MEKGSRPRLYWFLLSVAGVLSPVVSYSESFDEREFVSPRLTLLVVEVVPGPAPYREFCRENPLGCALTGPAVVEFDRAVAVTLNRVNQSVNGEVTFALDKDLFGREEYWTYPRAGMGDCEDIALEKRRRLVRAGLPGGALRLAIVQDRQHLGSHCILTVETTKGTYVLDSFSDEPRLWYEVPYNFEARERSDGQWERFDQSVWSYEP